MNLSICFSPFLIFVKSFTYIYFQFLSFTDLLTLLQCFLKDDLKLECICVLIFQSIHAFSVSPPGQIKQKADSTGRLEVQFIEIRHINRILQVCPCFSFFPLILSLLYFLDPLGLMHAVSVFAVVLFWRPSPRVPAFCLQFPKN